MKKFFISGLLAAVLTILASLSVYCQQVSDDNATLAALVNRYPQALVVGIELTEEYHFSLDNSSGQARVVADEKVSQVLVPLKNDLVHTDAVYYDGESSVENVRASGARNKGIRVLQQCADYQSEGIFYSDAKLCVMKIPLQERAVAVHYGYDKHYKDVKYLTSVYFHEEIPVARKILVFNVPDWLDMDLREFNFQGYAIDREVHKDADAKLTRYVFVMRDVPVLKKEYHAPNWARSYPHLVVVSKSFTQNGQKKVLFESVKDLYAWYHSLSKDIGNDDDVLKPIVSQLIKDKKTDVEKIESMYYWVQDKVRYIAFENGIMGFKPEAAQIVFKNKYGDCKGKANLLTQMLRVAGYDARLSWLGTSDLPYDYSLPSLAVDNHMISTLMLNGKHYFLDGTEEDIAFNDYAGRIQGKQVLIEDGNNFILDQVPEFPAERNKIDRSYQLRIAEGSLSGRCTAVYNGESKISLVGVYHSLRSENKKDALENFLRSGNPNIVIDSVRGPDWEDRDQPLQISFDVQASNQVTRAAGELYVNSDWDKEFSNFEFDSARENDYELDHKVYIATQVDIEVPDGYRIDYLPPAMSTKTADYSFEGSYVNRGKQVRYSKKIIVNKTIIRKKEFAAWNDFIRRIDQFYNDQVVLEKK